jgi:hypothetical protein
VTSVIDVWRAVDPEARLVSGSVDRLRAAVRGIARSRAIPPHLPEHIDGELLVLDASLIGPTGLDGLIGAFREAGLRPAAAVLAGVSQEEPAADRAGDPLPVLASSQPLPALADAATFHLDHAEDELRRVALELRLAAAEAALADPQPAAAAGLVAARLRRGVAVSADGELQTLHPRVAGRALAARFVALHTRLLAESPGRAASSRRTREGLHLIERPIRTAASLWLFDDLPFARIDEVAADALTVTLRALLRRPAVPSRPAVLRPLENEQVATAGQAPLPLAGQTELHRTVLAVARANGRVAVAARELGVHRNTVLYRLRRASVELGLDPRRAPDALAILREAEERTGEASR